MRFDHPSAPTSKYPPGIQSRPYRWEAAAFALLAVVVLAVALVWLRAPAPFLHALARPYPDADVLLHYQENLRNFPILLMVTSFALAAVALTLVCARPSSLGGQEIHPLALAATVQVGIALSLLLVAWWFSERHWLFWNRPLWDCYTLYAEFLHTAIIHPDGGTLAALVRFTRSYPHSPSPLSAWK